MKGGGGGVKPRGGGRGFRKAGMGCCTVVQKCNCRGIFQRGGGGASLQMFIFCVDLFSNTLCRKYVYRCPLQKGVGVGG